MWSSFMFYVTKNVMESVQRSEDKPQQNCFKKDLKYITARMLSHGIKSSHPTA